MIRTEVTLNQFQMWNSKKKGYPRFESEAEFILHRRHFFFRLYMANFKRNWWKCNHDNQNDLHLISHQLLKSFTKIFSLFKTYFVKTTICNLTLNFKELTVTIGYRNHLQMRFFTTCRNHMKFSESFDKQTGVHGVLLQFLYEKSCV